MTFTTDKPVDYAAAERALLALIREQDAVETQNRYGRAADEIREWFENREEKRDERDNRNSR